MKEALFYVPLEKHKVRCELCPNFCELLPGETGLCKVRVNDDGILQTQVYNKIAAFGIDPVEKKPLYHFHPGKNILSIGEVGCNLRCHFCQNHRISQCYAHEYHNFELVNTDHLVAEALNTPNIIGIAFTYNEPFTFFEFMLETAVRMRNNNLKNVVVSNGYVNPGPLKMILPYIDAFNIDMKGFTPDFYRNYTGGEILPVLESLKIISEARVHLEITNLVIPGINDDEKTFTEMVKWIAIELGPDVPLHLSRYFPHHEFTTEPTPLNTLEKLFEIAKQNLQHVYLGNVSHSEHSNTVCPKCGEVSVQRNRYNINIHGLTENGSCFVCSNPLNFIL